MFIINSMPKRKFGADSLRIIVGLETHRLREESAFVFRGSPLRIVRTFRRSYDRRPWLTWKSNEPVSADALLSGGIHHDCWLSRKTDLCKRSFCSEEIISLAATVWHTWVAVALAASLIAVLEPVIRGRIQKNSAEFGRILRLLKFSQKLSIPILSPIQETSSNFLKKFNSSFF